MKSKPLQFALAASLATFTSAAHAHTKSEFFAKTLNIVSNNTALKATLAEMGYSEIEAAERFTEAQEAAKNAKLDLKLGTLAICGKARIGAIFGARRGICTTLFNSYSVAFDSLVLGGQAMAGVEAIYFRSANRDAHEYCYLGASLSSGYIVSLDAGAMIETPCNGEKDTMGWDRGFFVQVSAGVGAGADFSADAVTVKHLKNYWEIEF
jgi:hypothetical protein